MRLWRLHRTSIGVFDKEKQEVFMLENKKEYIDDRCIDLTAYLGPRRAGKNFYNGVYGAHPLDPKDGYPSFITDEVFQLYKDAGLNFLMPEGDAYYGKRLTPDGFVDEPDFTKSDLYHYMEVAKRNGLSVYPTSEELFIHMSHAEGVIGEEEKSYIKKMIEALQKYFPDTFQGIMVTDEPVYSELGRVQSIMDYLHSDEIQSIKPNLKTFTSMLPIYGTLATFGPDMQENGMSSDAFEMRKNMYQCYIEACAKAMREFSVDFYPLVYEKAISPLFYINLEMGALHCKEKGIPLAVTLQSCRLDVDLDEKIGDATILYRTPNYYDMRWQVYSALAFGASRIGYYTFWPHYNTGSHGRQPNAMLVFEPSEEKGYRTTEIYDAVKEVHQEILAFDHVFLRFKWQGCQKIEIGNDENIQYVVADYKDEKLVNAKATRNLLIGCMKNPEDNMEGYWIVNAENPSRYLINDVELVFEGCDSITYYRKGKEYHESLTPEGIWKSRLGVGEGIFVIPYRTSEIER